MISTIKAGNIYETIVYSGDNPRLWAREQETEEAALLDHEHLWAQLRAVYWRQEPEAEPVEMALVGGCCVHTGKLGTYHFKTEVIAVDGETRWERDYRSEKAARVGHKAKVRQLERGGAVGDNPPEFEPPSRDFEKHRLCRDGHDYVNHARLDDVVFCRRCGQTKQLDWSVCHDD